MSLKEISDKVKQELLGMNFELVEEDLQRPWGGYLKINDAQADQFIKHFIPNFDSNNLSNISPKILFFSPNSRLSWQVHQRRSEVWQVLEGPVGAYLSQTDEEPKAPTIYQPTETIMIPAGTRHRNSKLDNWGVVAEIWVHTDPQNPSNEEDIRRISDDYNRN